MLSPCEVSSIILQADDSSWERRATYSGVRRPQTGTKQNVYAGDISLLVCICMLPAVPAVATLLLRRITGIGQHGHNRRTGGTGDGGRRIETETVEWLFCPLQLIYLPVW